MRAGFVRGILVFGAVAATAFAAYVRFGMGRPWLDVLGAWLLFLGALTLAPLLGAFLSPAAWGWWLGRIERRCRRGTGPSCR